MSKQFIKSKHCYKNNRSPFRKRLFLFVFISSFLSVQNLMSQVEVVVFNSLGQKIKNLVKGKQAAGRHQTTWNGHDNAGHEVASGIYFYKLRAGNFVQVKKMMLLR